MTKAKSDFRKLMDKSQALPDDCLLGYLVWFGVPDEPYDADHIDKEFDRLNLNSAMLPPPIKSMDAFKKSCTDNNGSKYDVTEGTVELLIRDVRTTPELVERHLIREVKSPQAQRLRYDKVGEIVFYRDVKHGGIVQKGSGRLRTTMDTAALHPEEQKVVSGMFALLNADFERYRDYHDGNKVRGIVRNYLKYLNAVMLKPSVYFVHRTRADEVLRLQEFVNGIDCTMSLMPLPDLKAMREEVIESYQREAVKELEDVVTAVQHLRSTRSRLTVEAYKNLEAQYHDTMRKATEYSRVLSISQDQTAGAAETALDCLTALLADVMKEG